MCRQVECPHCHKKTWEGCGMHVFCALFGVKEEDRCKDWKEGRKSVPCSGVTK